MCIRDRHQTNKKEENKNKDWAAQAQAAKNAQSARRTAWMDTAETAISAGRPFVLYIRADGDGEKTVFFTDLVKGKVEFPEKDVYKRQDKGRLVPHPTARTALHKRCPTRCV